MELVYLWVEEYKNIHKQGFNFSPRFNCHYDGETKKLIICDKKKKECENNDYIENFFGDNINITAIVGKNGSGKSSVLECLHYIIHDKININFNYILVYKIDEIYYTSNIEVNTNITKTDTLKIKFYIYSNELKTYVNNISIDKKNVLKYILFNTIEENFELTTFMYFPTKIQIENIDIDEIFKEVLEFEYNYIDRLSAKQNHENMRGIESSVFNLMDSIENNYHKFLIIRYCEDRCDYDYFTSLEYLNIDELKKELKESNIDFLDEDTFNTYINRNINENRDIHSISNKEKEILLTYSDFFKLDFIDIKNRNYNDLSHGEKTIFGQFLSIYYNTLNHYKDIIYFFDEPDLSLHPNWQKNYINELYNLLEKLNKKTHFIFTTHSPFLLSDLPKQNIIFLDKDEKGNCKVVDGLKEKKQTFGANIHTLLSDSFFMEDGLMGEFAKGKINEIKKFYEVFSKYQDNKKIKKAYKLIYLKKRKKFWQIQSIIGEPFLKTVIKNYLDDLEIIIFSDEKTLIEKELAEIEKRRVYLEGLKNDKT